MRVRWLRFWRWTAVALFGSILLLVWLIGSGWLDPKPVGSLRWQKVLPAQAIAAGSPEIVWLEEVTTADYSVRVRAVHQSGERDIMYGLVLGREGDYLVAAVSPLGYVGLWQGDQMILPLQPWPHVHHGSEPNEIWVDVENGQVTVRINREILWEGTVAVAGRVGVMSESWGETAVIQFESIQLFTP
jgi:hypothetical protein